MTENYCKLPVKGTRRFALVDPEDYQFCLRFRWNFHHKGYARVKLPAILGGKLVYLHRLILNTKKNSQIDHINHNKLDCRKSNLRLVSNAQQHYNTEIQKTYAGKPKSSKYKGVSYNKRMKKWHAYIRYKRVLKCLGYYNNEMEAVLSYNLAALKFFKEYAYLNNIPNGTRYDKHIQ